MIFCEGSDGKQSDHWKELLPPAKIKKLELRDEALSPEMKERETRGFEQICNVMKRFYEQESDPVVYARKELIVFEWAARGAFAQYPPEDWADLVRGLYFSIGARRN